MMKKYICPVCGYDRLSQKPYNDAEPFEESKMNAVIYGLEYGSFEICSCCGFEFGVDDVSKIKEYRENWLKNGAKWFAEKRMPKNWKLEEQLKNLTMLEKSEEKYEIYI